ncbi:general secretion pathway protein A [Luminiphilus syltensis NOR5-1B]|uniref:General secretion pathway protein A n=1 Tax=Luminiphilus syltensis NOR5-1B TaxID=565045 RepID=B8KSE4_9GAMM|nr:general secretion pathway protein A [Luminiphilus syltensis NOR5-1B]
MHNPGNAIDEPPMYYQHFGLAEAPFSISVNPKYLFMSPRHRDALAHLLYGVGSGGGFILLTGEVGTGKTTINRCLIAQLPENTDLAIVLNPALSAVELLATVCDELDVDYPSSAPSLKQLTDALHHFLLQNHSAGRRTVLMIDEAQHLDFDVLEQIRLLTNLETDEQKLLQIILIGQPELTAKLGRPELRQLNQRITARYELRPLNPDETGAYIAHRLSVAGLSGGEALFPPSVVRQIHRQTDGIPRRINLLCDRALLGAYGRGASRVDKRLVTDAANEAFGAAQRSGRLPGTAMLAVTIMVLLGLVLVGLFYTQDRRMVSESPPVSSPGNSNPVVVAPQTSSIAADAATVGPSIEPWLLPRAQAESIFWQLHTDAPPVQDVCSERITTGMQCVRDRASTWDALRGANRPVLLDMQTPDRFSAATVVLAFHDDQATVVAGDALVRVALVSLASRWQGGYLWLWQPPEDWSGPVGLGDESPVVTLVARDFAELDDQATPLAETRFNQRLEARVRLFQRSEGLAADGVVGAATMMRLNQRLGRMATGDLARARFERVKGEG